MSRGKRFNFYYQKVNEYAFLNYPPNFICCNSFGLLFACHCLADVAFKVFFFNNCQIYRSTPLSQSQREWRKYF